MDQVLGPLKDALQLSPEVIQEPGYAHNVQFFIETSPDTAYFCFYHGTDISFSSPVAGSIVLQRELPEGALKKIKIFFKDDAGSFLEIFPGEEEKSRMSIYLLGRKVQEDIRIPYSIEKLARIPVSEIMDLTSGYVDWSFYIPREDFPLPVLSRNDELSDQIRPFLRQLKDAEDGAINQDGEYVYIEDLSYQNDGKSGGLNCSGFAKWVVDGVLYPYSGTLLPIDILKMPHPDYRGNRWSSKVEDVEDPYFGLDWSRNLALQVYYIFDPEMKKYSETLENPELADVTALKYHQYKEDVGYPVESLETIMYELARRENDYFYLGSLNKLEHGDVDLRKHYHIAVFFPWLNEEGGLELRLMERNQESSLQAFIERHEGSYIHLVRVPHTGVFKPGKMELEPVLRR